jgi:malate dehydrogenase (oxaloacetate-decarboxylating)
MLTYSKRTDPFTGEEFVEVPFKGLALTEQPVFNKGTAFTEEERYVLDLIGLLPEGIATLEIQKRRTYGSFSDKPNDLEKYVYMLSLLDRNETLYYALVLEHLAEMLPIIYTPTVGKACQQFSHLYRRRRGLYISPKNIQLVNHILDSVPFRNLALIVISDGERILGLGDLGAGGMGIPIGKISLYVAAAGLHPAYCLPILLDVGTNNEELLNDPLYIGIRQQRLTGDAYDAVVEHFVYAVKRKFPNVLLQWEDFGKNNAFRLLDRYRERILSFNDDIQGTGSVVLAVLLSAMRLKKEKLSDQRYVIYGQGQAGIGIARQIIAGLKREGLADKEARALVFGIDKDGLLVEGMPISEEQKLLLKDRAVVTEWQLDNPNKISLVDTIRNTKATLLIGVTGQANAFNEEVISQMSMNCELPLIMPLSNPTSKAETTPEFALGITRGKCLIATGSPFQPVKINGRERIISQCNNLYVFPGVGLGALISGTPKVTDEMFIAASKAVSNLVQDGQLKDGQLLPLIQNIRRVSEEVAFATAKEARDSGLGLRADDEKLRTIVQNAMWVPKYLPYRYVK